MTRVTWKSYKLDRRHKRKEGKVRKGAYAMILVPIPGMWIVVKFTLEEHVTRVQGGEGGRCIVLLFLEHQC